MTSWRSIAGYGLLVGGMLAAYRIANERYHPFVPPLLEMGARGSKLGVILYHCGKIEEGLTICRQSVDIDPDSPMARVQLGAMYQQQGQPLEAVVQLRDAIRHDPEWDLPRLNLGKVLKSLGRFDEAAEQFRTLPDDPEARQHLEQIEQTLERQKALRGARP